MKKLFIIAILSIVTCQLRAQSYAFSIQYATAAPMGDTKDFIDKYSWRGLCISDRYLIKEKFYAGLETGWNIFYKKEYTSHTEGNLTITGTQFRYISAIPLLVNIGYSAEKATGKINPFAGLGIGTLYDETRVDLGLYQFTKETWHFLLKPEAGFMFNPGSDVSVIFVAKYFAGLKTKDMNALNYMGVNLGVAWTM